MKKKIALLVPVIALCICGLFFYMNRNSDDIDVAFTVKNEANTDSQYTLYLLGKGGKLGISSTRMKGIRVIASWEKPKDKIDSWLIFND